MITGKRRGVWKTYPVEKLGVVWYVHIMESVRYSSLHLLDMLTCNVVGWRPLSVSTSHFQFCSIVMLLNYIRAQISSHVSLLSACDMIPNRQNRTVDSDICTYTCTWGRVHIREYLCHTHKYMLTHTLISVHLAGVWRYHLLVGRRIWQADDRKQPNSRGNSDGFHSVSISQTAVDSPPTVFGLCTRATAQDKVLLQFAGSSCSVSQTFM